MNEDQERAFREGPFTPERMARARETVRATLRHLEAIASRDPDTRDDQEADGSGSSELA
jgi:hypothetical protein